MPSAKAYYNEWDPHNAEWIRNLVSAGIVAPGDVDQRDIQDVRPADLKGYTQLHFFAGIGLWSHALRAAGWPDDRPVWTGSCPCQPFSASGDGDGFDDERHLWPAWFWHIDQLRPDLIFGEQVASPDGLLWLDLVSNDLEARGYSCGPVDFPSAGIGAPNIRQRLFWMADAGGNRDPQGGRLPAKNGIAAIRARRRVLAQPCDSGAPRGLADADGQRRAEGRDDHPAPGHDLSGGGVANGRMADAAGEQLAQRVAAGTGEDHQRRANGKQHGKLAAGTDGGAIRLVDAGSAGLSHAEPRAAEGPGWRGEGRTTQQPGGPFDPWRELEWIKCADGKLRPSQPGIFPLAPRHPGDVAKLRAYGNAINPEVAAEFIRTYLDLGR